MFRFLLESKIVKVGWKESPIKNIFKNIKFAPFRKYRLWNCRTLPRSSNLLKICGNCCCRRIRWLHNYLSGKGLRGIAWSQFWQGPSGLLWVTFTSASSLFRSLGGQRRRPGANYRKKFGHVVVFFTVYWLLFLVARCRVQAQVVRHLSRQKCFDPSQKNPALLFVYNIRSATGKFVTDKW